MQSFFDRAAIVAVSATISIIISVLVLDLRYKSLLQSGAKLPNASAAELEKSFSKLKLIVYFDVSQNKYKTAESVNDFTNKLIVFSDFNCPYCATAQGLYEDYARSNNIEYIYYVETPILGPKSEATSLESVNDYIFDLGNYDRTKYFISNREPDIEDTDEAIEILSRHKALIRELGVNATPTYIIKGKFSANL
ncbi:MAG: hypothetical protein AAF292_06695 [Pseudomonadota bacterium]